MKDSQLEKMTVAELQDLRGRVDHAIVARRQREKSDFRERVEAMAKEAGIVIGDVFGGRRGRGGKAKGGGDVKYRHPSDPTLTWSGRGRKPNWVHEIGGDIEKYRV
jgi:DNA-binding protein H-NS